MVVIWYEGFSREPAGKRRRGQFEFYFLDVKIMADNLSESIQRRLTRIAGVPGINAQPSPCALDVTCPHCAPHKGVRLGSGASTIVATLCSCVERCALCAGSCMKPNRDNNVESCRAPSPRKVIGLINEARIPVRYLGADLAKFEGFSSKEPLQKTTVANWLRTLQPGKSSGLLLSGPVGMGKSWFLAAVAKHLAFQGISVRYADFFQLVHELRDAYSNDLSDKSSLRPFQQVDVLLIDELGKGRNSEWELSVADSLISERYNANKCIIAATNYPLSGSPEDTGRREINYLRAADQSTTNQMNANTFEPLSQRIGARMFSRLSENCVCIEVSGPDRRRR